jgi:hypothetical protein
MEETKSEARLDSDQINRLWQHGMHEERLFHDRMNYFSAVQAGQLGVFAILYHKEPSLFVFATLTGVGLIFTLLWLNVQVRHWRYCEHVNERIKRVVPEYPQTIAALAYSGMSIARPLAFAVPLLFAATWVCLFILVLFRVA